MIVITAKIEVVGTTAESGTSEILINRNNLTSFEGSIFDRSDIKMPYFGIISNGGTIVFRDKNGEVMSYAEQGLLNNGLSVTVKIENTIGHQNQTIATCKTRKWNYDTATRQVTVRFQDELEEWQTVQVEGFGLQDEMTAYEMYTYLKGKTPEKFVFAPLDSSLNGLQTQLKNFTIKNTYLQSGNLWAQWNKLCVLCGLKIFQNGEGKIVVHR